LSPALSERLRVAALIPHIAGVSAEDAHVVAEQWLADHGIPEDLGGRTVNVVVFASEDDCRFFYARRSLVWQQRMIQKLGRKIRMRKGKIRPIPVSKIDFENAVKALKFADTWEARREFIKSKEGLAGA
jgi:hypothetical protein